MKTREVKLGIPQTSKAALRQAAYIQIQIDHSNKRKENIMKNVEATEAKIAKLQRVLDGYRQQLDRVDTTRKDWEVEVESIKKAWNLTDAAILELRSELLRKQIAEMQKLAGVSETGNVFLD